MSNISEWYHEMIYDMIWFDFIEFDMIWYDMIIQLSIAVRGPIQELRHCLGRGLPIPVLHLVEYLSTDAGGMRWGRSYTGAGYLSFILLW